MVSLDPFQNETIFDNRRHAGRQLAKVLNTYVKQKPYLLALPRGGVEVGYEISHALNIPMDVLVVRKIGAPHNPEYAIGAIAEHNVILLDTPAIRYLNISTNEIETVIEQEKKELKRRIQLYRGKRKLTHIKGGVVIIVDDGLATGYTALAATQSVRTYSPSKIIFTAPVCAESSKNRLHQEVDDIICLTNPLNMNAIGHYYYHFEQSNDEIVINLLEKTKHTYN